MTAIQSAIDLLEAEGYRVTPPRPKCSTCSDQGHYVVQSSRGESEDTYCRENCAASAALKEADARTAG